MFDRYPVLSIIFPLIMGMIVANYSIDIVRFNNWLIFIVFAIIIIATSILFVLSLKKTKYIPYFSVASAFLFIFFGFIYEVKSMNDAQEEFGDKWRQSIYFNNKFQISKTKEIQSSIHNWYVKHGIDDQEGAILEAMTIGVKENLSKETKEFFSQAGVSHILALSGYHIGIIYFILQFVFLHRIVSYRWRTISHILTISFLWLYAFIAGMSPSLVRAVIMCSLLIVASIHTHQLLSINALALSALIMLLINPLLILHVGFQLSYMSMLGIYIIGLPLCQSYQSYTFIDRFIWCTICISLTCTIFTMPIVAYTFHRIPTLSIFSNIIITALTYLLIPLVILWVVCACPDSITQIINMLSNTILLTTKQISEIPHSTLYISPSQPAVILFYCLLAISLILIKGNNIADKKSYG